MGKHITNLYLKAILLLFAVVCMVNDGVAQNLARIDANSFITVVKVPADLENQMFSKNKVVKTQNTTHRVDFTVNAKELYKSFNGKNAVYLANFPLGQGKTGNLRLYYSRPAMDKNSKVTVLYKGQAINYKLPEFSTYYGTIDGDNESDVYLNISEKGIDGVIQNGLGNMYNVGENVILSDKITGLHTLVPSSLEESMYYENISKYCGASDVQNYESYGATYVDPEELPKVDKFGNIMATQILESHLAIEGDYVYFFMFKKKQQDIYLEDEADNEQAFAAGIAYINKVVAMGSRIYQREVNITFKIDTIILYADPSYDGYNDISKADLSDKLGRMPQVWSNRSNINRTLVTLFSNVRSQPANATVLGIARMGNPFTGVLCSQAEGYAAVGVTGQGIYPTFNYSQDLQVFVHELGHNFSSPHTHNCYWNPPLDTCLTKETNPDTDACITSAALRRTKMDGDIMSYCHFGGSIVYKFHPEVKKRIRGAAEKAKNLCMPIPTDPTLQLTYPIGSEVVFANSKINIGWNSEKVNRVNLFYSLDGAKTWIEIVSSKSIVNDSTYSWTVPNVTSTNAFIKIVDASSEAVFDQSVLPFNIVQKTIKITSPASGQEVGYSIPFNIQWNKNLVDKVSIQVSVNGGENWLNVAQDVAGINQSFKFPDVATDNALLRVVDNTNSAIYDQVMFKLGKEVVDLQSPKTGDLVCTPNPNFKYYFAQRFTDKINIWFSKDGKQTWVKVNFQPIDRTEWKFEWKGTSNTNNLVPTEQAYVKVTPAGDNNFIITEEGPFTVYDCPLSVQDGQIDDSRLRITEISPNPTNDKSVLKYYVDLDTKMANSINIEVFDIAGNLVLNNNIKNFSAGENVADLSLSSLSQGSYFVVVSYGELKSIQVVKVVK